MDLAGRMAAVRELIDAAAARAGRRGSDVTLVAITKSAPPTIFSEARAAGLEDVGESRVQAVRERMQGHADAFRWHLVGHLQRNKVRTAVKHFDVIHSVDSPGLIDRIDRIAGEEGRRPAVLLQVNVSGEASKSGLTPTTALDAAERAAGRQHLRLVGLMTMAPQVDEVQATRPVFARLAALRERIAAEVGIALPELSMGMSNDFAIAVEEGATLVRVGRRLVDPDFAVH